MSRYTVSLVVLALAMGYVQVARVVEIETGHAPSMISDTVFSALVTALIGMVAVGRSYHEPK